MGSIPSGGTHNKIGRDYKHAQQVGNPLPLYHLDNEVFMDYESTPEEIVKKAKFALTNMIGDGIIDLGKLKSILDGR